VLGKRSRDLPGYVLVGNGNEHPGCGFLDPAVTPVPLADPERGLENVTRPAYLSQANFERRLALADRLDRDFRTRYAGRQIAAYDQMVADAVRLMGSGDLAAFDIAREDEATRDRYGRSRLGQGCLLARRLVEGGVRCVEVEMNGWDMHRDLWDELPEKAGELDAALAALVEDLEARGLLASTLVVLATEFGRTPKINENAGRDHHPGVFSCVLAGAGVKRGVVHGAGREVHEAQGAARGGARRHGGDQPDRPGGDRGTHDAAGLVPLQLAAGARAERVIRPARRRSAGPPSRSP